MNKYLLLTNSNMKKAKSQTITIIALVLIAAIFLNIWLVLTIDYSANYEKRSNELNSEQSLVTFAATDEEFEKICADTLKSDGRVDDYEINKIVFFNTSVKYSVGTTTCNFSFISESDAKNKQIGKFKFLGEESVFEENTVYIPYLFHSGGGYNIGDKFEIELAQKKFSFTVGGFFESMMSGSTTGGVVSIVINDDMFKNMQDELDLNNLSLSIKLKDNVDDKKFTSGFVDDISSKRLVPYFSIWKTMSKQTRTFISSIVGSIIAMVAFLITVIALIVIAFNISNKVEEDMQSLGVLKGIGYKSNQIVLSILLQFLTVALAASVVGIACSYAVLPIISELLLTQTGIIWQYGFGTMSAGITFFFIGSIVGLITFLSARKIKKITPMTALRDGIETHNFKKNTIALEKSKLNINAALGFKLLSKNKKQSVAIAIILSILTIFGVFAGTLFNNVAIAPEAFIKMVQGESSDMAIFMANKNTDEVITTLEQTKDINNVHMFHSNTVYINDTDIMGFISDDFTKLNNQTICYEGRLPKHDNEVALGGLFAKENNLKVGDTISLRFNKPKQEYLITGFTQSANYMGQDCMLTKDGFEKIGDLLFQTYFVNVDEGADINETILSIESQLNGKIISIINFREAVEGSSQVYIDMLSMISTAVIVLLLLVILLVLYLMVKTFVLKKRKEMGILKAIGYTTSQLILQTIISFLPTVIVGVALGAILGVFLTNPLFTIILKSVGIMKSMFEISLPVIIEVALGIILFSLVVTFFVSRRIRTISAHKLLVN